MDFIHVGLHKTATTYLQKNYFPKINMKYISNELLSGNINSFDNEFIDLKRELILLGIYTKYGKDIKVIIGIRNKEEWIKSVYNQVVKSTSYFKSFKSFCEVYNYDFMNDYVKYTEFLFGNNLYIFNYDKFKEDQQNELDKLSNFLGVDIVFYNDNIVNSSISGLNLIFKRLLNLFYEFVKLKIILNK